MDNVVHNHTLPTENGQFCGQLADQVLLIFAKQPVPGYVKTRLTPQLSSKQAATFYALSQMDTLKSAQRLNLKIVICYTGERGYFSHQFPQIELCDQGDGDLGQRLQRMFAIQWQRGVQQVCVIGTDSPDLPVEWITEIFTHLEQHDVMTIPATDGGYVLLGCSRPCPELFQNINWSSSQVLQQTREHAQQAGCRYAQLHQWQDVDDVVSLRSYAERSLANKGLAWSRSGNYARRCLRHVDKQK